MSWDHPGSSRQSRVSYKQHVCTMIQQACTPFLVQKGSSPGAGTTWPRFGLHCSQQSSHMDPRTITAMSVRHHCAAVDSHDPRLISRPGLVYYQARCGSPKRINHLAFECTPIPFLWIKVDTGAPSITLLTPFSLIQGPTRTLSDLPLAFQ